MAIFRFLSARRPAPRGHVKTVLLLEELEDRWLPSAPAVVFPLYQVSLPYATAAPANSGTAPPGLNPTQIRHAYGIDAISFPSNGSTVPGDGAGETIAIVDAYDDPSIASDLAVFDQQFGIPAPPSFTKVGIDANGNPSTTSFPQPDADWDGEIELDVEWSHAIAPAANILLVEANSADTITDLTNAISYAQNYPGVVAVSMSWGGGEFSGETSDDTFFTTPTGHVGETFFASSGDNGYGTIWPSVSSHVVAAGGTTLNVDSAGDYEGESAWAGSGGGISSLVTQPSYQSNLQIYSGDPSADGMRAVPDVAYDADPNTGVAVYGTAGFGSWEQVGGTSASSPQWAALMAIVDQGRAVAGQPSLDGYTQTLPALYRLPASDFNDITTGSNGYPAGPGFDLATGLGTPIANQLVPDLGAPTAPQVLTSVAVSPANSTVGNGGQQQFVATGLDQFGRPMVQQPTFAWSLASGAGTLSSGGLYTAPNSGIGAAIVEATAGGASLDATANVNYLPGPAITSLSANPDPVTATTTTLSALVSDPNPAGFAYTWSIVSESGGAATPPSFTTASGTSTSGSLSTTATFSQAGAYLFQLSVTDASNIVATDQVSVTVNQTPTSLQVSPPTVSLGNGVQQQFTASIDDQFGNPLPTQPAFTWSVASGAGTISGAGLYTSPSSGIGVDTVAAQANVNGAPFSGSATVAYSPGLSIASLSADPNPVTDGATTLNAVVGDPNSVNLYYNWSVVAMPAGVGSPSISSAGGYTTPGGITAAVTFYGAGTYQFELDVSDDQGMTTSATVTVTVVAQPPAITAIAANPSPVIGSTTTLSAQVADGDPGEFYYDWWVVSVPVGGSYPSINNADGFATPGSLSAPVTFNGPGTYQFELDINDAWGLTTSDTVSVTVVAQLPTITAIAANPSPVTGSTTTLSASVTDSNPGEFYYDWWVVSVPVGGSYPSINNADGFATPGSLSAPVTFNGPGTYQFELDITDAWGLSTSATVSVTVVAQLPAITAIAANPSPVIGSTTTLSAQVADNNPGEFYYDWWVVSVPVGGSYPTINNASGYTAPGGISAPVTFSGPGTYQFELDITDAWGLSTSATVSVTVPAQPPTISSLSASPSPVTGTTTTLKAQVADANSASLAYSWSVVNGPGGIAYPTITPASGSVAPGSFSVTAAFDGVGTYQFQLSITDGLGQTASGTVSVTVTATPTVAVTPPSATVADGSHQQFTASAVDQFGNALATQPTFTWSITRGSGAIDSGGLYAAPATGSGAVTVQAAAVVNGKSIHGTATVTLLPAPTITSISGSPNPVTGKTTTLSVTASDPGGTLSYAWSALTVPSGAPTPTFSSSTSRSTIATFYEAGVYTFEVQVTNQAGLNVSSTVSVTVNQTLTRVTASPATVPHGTQQQLTAAAFDQFGLAMATTPTYTWSLVSGVGSISSAGLYKAPASGRGTATIKVTAKSNGITVSVNVTVTVT